jgi:hypothetical protein
MIRAGGGAENTLTHERPSLIVVGVSRMDRAQLIADLVPEDVPRL